MWYSKSELVQVVQVGQAKDKFKTADAIVEGVKN